MSWLLITHTQCHRLAARRFASVLATRPLDLHYERPAAQHVPMLMDPLQYILQPKQPAEPSGARKLALAIMAQQHALREHTAGSPRILSVEHQPHGRTIEVEMSASDLHKLLQCRAPIHAAQESSSPQLDCAAGKNLPESGWSAAAMISAGALGAGALWELGSDSTLTAESAFACNALYCVQ